ncbi:MAG: 16S rRNA (adenine(1518)-N(6)/adenine(1519)-N(6))-dimethyltransferase RsmA [Chlamydiae bacterium]|nr:16S rRNA (adenine(1518)-N(6)/adenine(1519)-N(6))-dimethyltransferase RsmA [Chlamydiota bacterium]
MTISTPSVLHDFLQSHGMKAKKHASQNFLIDGNIIRKIVSAAQVQKGDVVLEIGPGPGALTQEMLLRGAQVIAVEKDPLLAKALYRLQTEDSRLLVIEQDILEFPFETFFHAKLSKGQKIKVVANLPYHITTPIITSLLPKNQYIESMTLMVQKEVARRFVALRGSKEYSSFTVYIEHFGQVKYCFTVEPTCFYPKPSIQSAIVHFTLENKPIIEKQEILFPMIRTAFSKRRKMLKSSLKELYPSAEIEKALEHIGLNPLARPEELSRDHFIALHQKLIE